ncbi:MAG: substrate-binding domain-containing protein [Paracoccaceae bacterium]
MTIADLAERLGLTKGTVSRALNGYPDISERTKRRVERAAKKIGYRPLSHAQAIKTGRARSLGLVLNVDADNAHKPFLTDFLDGISRKVSEENWTLTVATATSEADVLETFRRLVHERKVDGFILPRTRIRDPRIDFLRQAGLPFVLFGRTANPDGCAWFDIRGEDAMKRAVLRLAGFGHRRIGFINGGAEYNYNPLRREGFLAGLRAAGLEADGRIMRDGAMTSAHGHSLGAELLDLDDRPSAIVCALDAAALGVYRAARERGLEIGSDLSVIAYDGIPEGDHASPPLTTFSVDSRAAGARLAEILLLRIRGAPPEALRETVDAVLTERSSDGPPAGKYKKQAPAYVPTTT